MLANIPEVQAGDVLSAKVFNTVTREVMRLSNLTVEAPLELTQGPAGPVISLSANLRTNVFWSQISGTVTGGLYAWDEVEPEVGGGFVVKTGGRNDTNRSPAYAVTGTNALMVQMPGTNGAMTYFFLQPPAIIPVLLTSDGGSIGNKTTVSSWTYTVKDLRGNTLGTTMTPLVAWRKGKLPAASYGIGYTDTDGTFKLMVAFTTSGTGGC